MNDRSNDLSLLRVIDVNANRAAEGLRVVEEYARFVLEDGHLAGLLKKLRHELHTALAIVDPRARSAARETRQDVGVAIRTEEEFARTTARDIAQANQKRVEQSLRCLEEFLKPLDSDAAGQVEQLRYRAYTLARALEIAAASRVRLADARLYVLIDGQDSPEPFRERVNALLAAEPDVVQLRDKRLPDRELLERARALRHLTQGTRTLFVINDRPDLAVLSQADGVHVGQDELHVKDVRRVVGAEMLIGVSTHDLEQAREAVLDGADYIGCGPTFPSTTKAFTAFTGLEFLRQVAAEISLPAFAIGGITAENLPAVLQTGIQRIATAGAAQHPAELHHLRTMLAR